MASESSAVEVRRLPSNVQRAWLVRGVDQPGGKLPLFDDKGRQIDPRTIRSCLEQGWAEPWFDNPLKSGWLVCKLTTAGRAALNRPAAAPQPDPIFVEEIVSN